MLTRPLTSTVLVLESSFSLGSSLPHLTVQVLKFLILSFFLSLLEMGLLSANIHILTSCLARPYCSVRHSEVDILFLLTFLQVCALGITPSVNWSVFPQILSHLHFLGGTSSKESTCRCRRHRRCESNSWVGKTPWRVKWQPTPVFLPGESHGQRSLAGYNPGGHRVRHDWTTEHAPFLWCMTWHVHNNIRLGDILNNFQIPGQPITMCI